MKYTLKPTAQFKKDVKRCVKAGLNPALLTEVLTLLQEGLPLPEKYLDHPLRPSRQYLDCRELHIEPDWLLVYKYAANDLILFLVRTGSHATLFR